MNPNSYPEPVCKTLLASFAHRLGLLRSSSNGSELEFGVAGGLEFRAYGLGLNR